MFVLLEIWHVCYVCFTVVCLLVLFVLKQKTVYEMRISDWSSDVCSSDLPPRRRGHARASRLRCHARPTAHAAPRLPATREGLPRSPDPHARGPAPLSSLGLCRPRRGARRQTPRPPFRPRRRGPPLELGPLPPRRRTGIAGPCRPRSTGKD